MKSRKIRRAIFCGAIAASSGLTATAQTPTLPTEVPQALPGSNSSALGAIPGSGGGTYSDQAVGGGQILGGRPGSTTPRVPTSISTPGAGGNVPSPTASLAVPSVAPLTEVPLYGTLDVPAIADEGPPDGMTFDQALEILLGQNLDLLARRFEIPSAQADILTASLRANPIFYADSQLIPYGSYTKDRPGGQTQYDVNVSLPIDYSHKRRGRVAVATQAKRSVEALYQDAIRLGIGNLANAYVAVLAARETVRYTEAGSVGLERILAATRRLQKVGNRTSADVSLIEAQRGAAELGVMDAREGLRKAKLALGALLNMTTDQAEAIEIRATLRDLAPPLPTGEELAALALSCRPDVVANRLGVGYAKAGLDLQKANRYADAYLLFQPYTFQSNAPLHLKSPTSYALGITVPLPVFNRNQGNIERAKINIQQTQVQVAAIERLVVKEVRDAEREYAATKVYLDRLERDVIPSARKAMSDSERLFEAGETADITTFLNVQQRYNDLVRLYRDTAVRHRRSMFTLNTAVGSRILP